MVFRRFGHDGTLFAIRTSKFIPQGVCQMFRLLGAFIAAALFTAFAVDRAANGEDSSTLALEIERTDTMENPPYASSPDDYAGVYETADGATFVVTRHGESLSIALPESVALPIRAAGPGFALDTALVLIAFENDGECLRLVLSRALEEPVVATRLPLPRGVVTIQDI
jgi:hypothetical protein